jgi:hypothetical protein
MKIRIELPLATLNDILALAAQSSINAAWAAAALQALQEAIHKGKEKEDRVAGFKDWWLALNAHLKGVKEKEATFGEAHASQETCETVAEAAGAILHKRKTLQYHPVMKSPAEIADSALATHSMLHQHEPPNYPLMKK